MNIRSLEAPGTGGPVQSGTTVREVSYMRSSVLLTLL